MKKLITLSAMLFLLVGGLFAQKLSYQAVVRNSSNELVVNTALTVEVSIKNAANTVQYAETHSVTSNQNGLIVLTIGEGTVTTGTNLSAVNWEGATINSVIKNGSATVTTISSPVNAVPYALQAANASGSFSQVQADWNETNTASKAYIVNKPDLSVFITTETDPTVPAWAKESTKPAYDYYEIVNTPDLTNYLTTENDPTVPAWAKEANKPAYNYNEITGTPDLSNYLTTESDPNVPAWAKEANKPAYNYNEITGTPDLSNYLTTESDPNVPAWAKEANKPAYDYSEIANTPAIPTTVAQLTDAADYAKLTDIHNSTITINQNGTLVGSFTLNQTGDQTINLAGGGSGGTGVTQSLNLNGNVISLTPNGGEVTLPAETDPTVSAWAKAANKPVYDYSEITNTPNLSGYLTSETDPTVPAWAKTPAKPVYDYSEITNTPDLTVYATTTAMNNALADKADANNVYTKAEADDLLGAKADTATVNAALATLNTALDTKANADDVYTKAQTDEKLGAKADTATVNAALATVNTALNTKANSADVYTKAQADEKLGAKADTATVNAALATVNTALDTKANSADVYTKAQADEKLGAKADTATVNAALAQKANTDYVNDALALKADNNAIFTKDQTKQAISDSLSDIRTQMTALATQMNNLLAALNALQVTTEQFNATDGQTAFTLTGTPNGEVVMYINGVMVGSKATNVIAVSGSAVTYNPSYNYSYALKSGDKVTFMFVSSNN